MAKKTHIWIALLFSLIPFLSYSTHVVGGSLTYIYNGGSNYTITLKLYRDCGAGTAALPGNVTIQILGYNGLPFTPSKNVTINLTSVTNIAASLDPCAIPPNPAPCVEEAIYTTTVNNLPPNAGGYHMYFQICCRNGSILNITSPGAAGESFYANIPGMSINTLWNEDFTLPNNTTIDNGATSWSITPSAIVPSSANVTGNIFQIAGANNAGETWTSQVVNISSCGSANLSVNLFENGTLEPNDSILVYYRINGGPLIPFPTNGFKADDFTSAIATANGLAGSTIQIVIRVHFDLLSPNTEIYSFDNITITCIGNNFIPNSNPVFNLFPPLFICVNQPLTFNHSATDANGDSLVYSLYQPYNNTAPTFTNNIATFPPITYVGGYNSSNPLGAGPFNINSSTGLLTGTPGTIGQFVVGVMVKEYRNGVYIGETIRDFQFNVVNCPIPPPTLAVPNATINNNCSAKITATGVSSVSTTWTSVFPGTLGAFNNYLACTASCVNNTVTPIGVPPPFVDFVVCGISTTCAGTFICDTFRVYFNPTLVVNIIPLNPTLCFGQTSTTITANGSGGTPPYNYLWNNVNPSQTVNVGVGTYNVQLSDASGCPPVFNSVTVTAFSVAITANAGLNQTKCIQSPIATLTGTVTGASGGIWSGGSGTFTPNNTTLSNIAYSPTPAELASGSVNLILTTTGNGTCPLKIDTVKITYVGFTGVVTPSIINVSCFGGSNGSGTMNLSGGITPYTYLWNTVPTQTTSTASNLPIGTYSVTIRDGVGCTFPTTVNITQPPILAINSITSNVSCSGASTGSISVTPVGGTIPYTYSWSPGGQTTSSITGLPAGNYSVNVTDAKGCIKNVSYTITQPLPIAITFTQTNVTCFNAANGSVNTNVTGGTVPYSYSWTPGGATSQNVTGLQAGTYTLTVTDNLNCIATNTVAITQPTLLVASTTVINETCNYLNNGSATATQTGGTAGYTYSWQPGGQTTSSITNQASGTYTVIVTDSKGCTSTAVAVINEPTPLTVSFVNQINVSCFGGTDGSVGASPAGGTPNYTYSWSPGGNTNASLSNIPIGTYTVTVTDNHSCLITNTVVIIQPTDIITTSTITNVSCNGGSNGTISLTPTGGTSPYTYLWSVGGQTTSSVTGLPVGSYSVTVMDAHNCQKKYVYTVTQPLPIVIAFTQNNVSCFNGANGTANSTITGGTVPYTYSWAPGGATTQNVTGLIAGTYTLTVTDNLNCIATKTIAITQPPILIASTTVTNETCNYLNNGSATASQTGGTAGYTYSWQPGGQTSASITSQASGTYTVIITDSKGCNSTAVAVINEPAPLMVNFINQINVSCFGGSDGSIGASPAGGTPNYTYSWAPGGSTNASLSNIPIGTYTVTVTDNHSCLITNTVVIIQPTDIITTSTITNVSCNGGSNGTIALTPTGGTSPYTYLWSVGGQTTSSVTGLLVGSYSVTVTDAHNCKKNYVYTVIQPLPIVITFTQTNVSCFNGANGTANTNVTGGTVPYTYNWALGGATTQNVIGLIAGTYTLTVTDNLNCIATKTIAITQPPILIASTTVTNETCNYLNNGSATASQTGGTAGYTYSWQPGGQTSASITNQASGTYTVIVTDSKGCISTAIAVINEPTPLTVSFVNQINVSCFGGSNGSIGASPAGGTPNYTYSWTPGGATTSSLLNISAGTYSVTITDNKNCTVQNTIAITQPTAALNAIMSSVPAICNGGSTGSASASATGGTPVYSYSWMPGAVSSQTISNIISGTYTVTVADSKGCIKTNTVFVNQPAPILPVTTSTNSTCGSSNGIGSVSVTGGISPYTYQWLPAGGTSSVTTGIPAGVYSVTVKDANNCTAIQYLDLDDSSGPNASIFSTTNVSCFGGNNGSATASIIGGLAPITYTWFPTGGNGTTANGLIAGTYYIVAKDNNGCVSNAITSPSITEPPLITASFLTTDVKCFGGTTGSATVTAGGGVPGYTYSWLPGATTGSVVAGLTAGTYSVQITDTHSCINTFTYSIVQPTASLASVAISSSVSCFGGSNGTTSVSATGGTSPYNFNWMPGNLSGSSISNLIAGTYTATTTDIKNCTTSTTITVTQPTPIVLTTNSINSNCGAANGQASVSATGGVGGYTYSWTPSGGTSNTATGLLAGSYLIRVKDANFCVASATQTVVDNPGPIVTVASTTSVSCFGGSNATATASVSGGTGPFTYTWSPSGGNNATATGLPIGTYTVFVTAGNGCLASATSPTIIQPTLIFSSITTSNVNCFAGANGSATVTAGGGTPGYTYLWLPGATTGSVVTGLTAGTYSVQITDSHSCINTFPYSITQPTAALTSAAISSSVSCFGGSNGTTSVSATGGTLPYNFNWMPGNFSGSSVSNLVAGTYTATTTDIKNCTKSTTITVTQPTPIVLTTGSINSNCGAANGQASVSATGGVGGYTYSWTPTGGTSATATGLLTGSYSIQVKDANLCVASATQTVVDNPGPIVTIASTTSVSCFGGSNATATASVSGGTGPFTYTWSPSGGNNATATGLPIGTYTVFVTAGNGCLASATSPTIIQPTLIFSSITTSNVNCFAGANGSATVTAGGGTPGYTYLWLPGATTGSVVTGLSLGTYSVQITDSHSCINTFTYSITQPTAALAASATSTAVSCFSGNNGTASASATGGTSPYNFNWLPMSVNSPTIGGLAMGVYTVNVTDSKNCTTSTTVSVTQPTLGLSATANSVPTSCSGGSDGTATITATGGTGSYSYSWSPSGGAAQTASGLLPGTYFVDVTDANSCLTNVSVIISSPTPVTGSLTSINPACGFANGSVTSQVSGGIGPYTYTWSPGSVNTSSINGLLPGIYTLNASDSFGCIKTLTTTLINIPGTTLSLISTLNDSCFGGSNGSATINISQGTLPYSTNWLPFGGNTTTASQLTAGVYTANVTDGRGCLSTITATITEPSPVAISINTIVNVSCFNSNNGSITVTASGGTPGYTYSWSPAGTGQTINNLTAGTYIVNVKDSHFCPSSISMNVTQPATALTSTINSVNNPVCFNSTGNASVTVTGGTTPYTYSWTTNPIQTSSNATNLVGGTYTVNVFDANGCTTSNTLTLIQPTQIVTNAGLNDTICLGQSGAVMSSASGGAGNYYYVWQPLSVTNSGTLTVTPAINTTYTVVAFDQNGCAGLPDTVKAIVFTLTPSNVQTFGLTPICPGQGSVISALATGNTGPVFYSWNNGLGNGPGPFIVTPTQPTSYIVTVSNSCGASVSDSLVITINPPPTILASISGTLACIPNPINFFDNSISGNINDPITNWLWDFGDGATSNSQNPNHIYTEAGTYSVSLTATTDGGCTNNNGSSPIFVNAYPHPDAQFSINSSLLNLPYDILICTNQSTGATMYNWNFGDGGSTTVTNPNHTYITVGTYQIQLIATSQFGCKDTAYAEIITDADVVFPNAFTPNGNGPSGGHYSLDNLDNDIFFPYTSGVIEFKFQIFNRWGELIFETEDIKQGWDGYYRDKICQVGVYIWKAYVKLNNGKVFNKTGDVTLLR